MRRRPIVQATIQEIIRWTCRLLMMIYFRIRIHGLHHYPTEDGFLICSNHQSHLDPVVVGATCPRPINYVGRESLTKCKPFGDLLYYNDLIAIDREGGGFAGLKETMRRLRNRETVVIFPEGTRTRDGKLQEMKMGFATIVRKVKAPILPMAFDGSFQAMPRSSWFIRPAHIVVVMGSPITEADYSELSDEQLGELLRFRIGKCFEKARKLRNS
jgi:1-acyl-sn-glycerol-3-phosphate acyltransferase